MNDDAVIGLIDELMSHWIHAQELKSLLDPGVPVVLDFVIGAAREMRCYLRPPKQIKVIDNEIAIQGN